MICEPAILAIVPPMITAPATILNIFTILSFKNFEFSQAISVGGEGDGNPSDIKFCEGANPSNAEK
jgi:hypothetical protein